MAFVDTGEKSKFLGYEIIGLYRLISAKQPMHKLPGMFSAKSSMRRDWRPLGIVLV
jgi:hypothetical protein